MKYILLKDQKQRSKFQKFEIQQKIIKSLVFNTTLSSVVRRKLSWQLNKVCILFSLVYIKNYCIFSGRSSSVFSFFNLSRLVVKKFYDLNYIPNLTKSSW
jgi:small subunit ribosomal protein S14